ncbi:unnamed protein product [Miscanthus lutarioriparius]|uniref:FLZ-type domain-containing protein n=1 Tax=Miscanthus lutarioriparius TaxID=422564 RepID=A0A811MSR7_9POAL|nr:unnamed protein product [Miscanthus lutarioriparius]
MAASGGELLVGLRLIIQPSPRKQLPTVLRKSAVRIPPASTSTSAAKCHDNGGRVFAGLEFLKRCSCCHKDLDATMDVFVYKYLTSGPKGHRVQLSHVGCPRKPNHPVKPPQGVF